MQPSIKPKTTSMNFTSALDKESKILSALPLKAKKTAKPVAVKISVILRMYLSTDFFFFSLAVAGVSTTSSFFSSCSLSIIYQIIAQ